MPTLSRWFIKSGFFCFVAAMAAALIASPRNALGTGPLIPAVQPVFYHLFMVGWITQLIMGVSFWMFPRYSKEKPRGPEASGWLSFAFLDTGLFIRVFSEPLFLASMEKTWGYLLVASAILQWLSGALFVMTIWGRIKEK